MKNQHHPLSQLATSMPPLGYSLREGFGFHQVTPPQPLWAACPGKVAALAEGVIYYGPVGQAAHGVPSSDLLLRRNAATNSDLQRAEIGRRSEQDQAPTPRLSESAGGWVAMIAS